MTDDGLYRVESNEQIMKEIKQIAKTTKFVDLETPHGKARAYSIWLGLKFKEISKKVSNGN